MREGLGQAIINFYQQSSSAPEKLWAAIFISGLLGIAFYLVVQVAEAVALRQRRAASA
jgi:ABC-type nitrate/sulfonate/bicarbonate transport system permease component